VKPYQKFATVYDKIEADRHSARMVEYTIKLMLKFRIEAVDALDLCCGTGTALKLLSESGLSMTGLDRSRAMLKQAAAKLKGKGVRLVQAELPRFRIYGKGTGERKRLQKFDLVTSFYDSLNYLASEKELKAAFRSVHQHLRPSGCFIFDMNTPKALRTIWSSQVWGGVKDDVAWIFRNEHDELKAQADCLATFFLKQGKLWERFDEKHTERAYRHSTIKKLLRDSGFRIRGYYRCFSLAKATDSTDRICVLAQKPERKRTR